jgi:hypothetical protein
MQKSGMMCHIHDSHIAQWDSLLESIWNLWSVPQLMQNAPWSHSCLLCIFFRGTCLRSLTRYDWAVLMFLRFLIRKGSCIFNKTSVGKSPHTSFSEQEGYPTPEGWVPAWGTSLSPAPWTWWKLSLKTQAFRAFKGKHHVGKHSFKKIYKNLDGKS